MLLLGSWIARAFGATALLLAAMSGTPSYAEDGAAGRSNIGDCIGPMFSPGQTISANALTRMIDIPGSAYANIASDVAMSVSPNGRMVALQMQQADPDRDIYCLSWYVIDLTARGARPSYRGDGGDVIFRAAAGAAAGRQGLLRPIAPHWSPDNSWFAYLRRDASGTQIWRSWIGDRAPEKLTQSPDPIVDFVVDASGGAIIFKTLPDDDEAKLALNAREDREGYLVDQRFSLITQALPVRPASLAEEKLWRLDLSCRCVTRGRAPDKVLFDQGKAASTLASPRVGQSGAAWFENIDPAKQGFLAPLTLAYRVNGQIGAPRHCASAECTGSIYAAFWRGDEFIFLGDLGPNHGERAFYAYRPGDARARLILRTNAQFFGCAPSGRDAICLEEDSAQPRRLVRLDLDSGAMTEVLDPNPDFAARARANVRRVYWSTPEGGSTFGDLVLPASRKAGERLPLVIVQYRSRGFLRGGVGDEYPIWLYAASGFAVLSVDVADEWWRKDEETIADPKAIMVRTWAAHKRISFVSLEEGLRQVEKLGLIDMDHIGLTGLSNGADTLCYALVHSNRFAAAISSGGMWDPTAFYLFDPATQARLATYGLDLPDTPAGLETWRWISPALNAAHIETPLMINAADREVLFSAATAAALRLHGKPVAFYVMADEYHDKWRPAHRRALYQRNVDWMAFWLKGEHEGIAAEDLGNWLALKSQALAPRSGPHQRPKGPRPHLF